MAFNVTCGTTTAEKRALDKTMSSVVSVTGTLRNASSVVDPVIILDASASSLAGCNYMHIGTFGRYYFITDVVSLSDQLCEVHGHCDVLKTYASGIRKNQAIIARSSNDWLTNSLIVDPQAKFSNKKNTKTIRIGGFDKVSAANLFSFVLVTM